MTDSWGLNEAKKYFLVPLKDQKSLYLIGGKNRMLRFEMINDEKIIVAFTGINTEECYILVNKTGEECQLLIDKMREIIDEDAQKAKDKD